MENYSGFLNHTDEQVGRLIGAVERSGEMDNTLIIFLVGDNGASAEGGLEGTVSEIAAINGFQLGLAGWKPSSMRLAVQRLIRTFPWAGLGRWTPLFNGPSKSPPTSVAPGTG